jgi:hypothetical protein
LFASLGGLDDRGPDAQEGNEDSRLLSHRGGEDCRGFHAAVLRDNKYTKKSRGNRRLELHEDYNLWEDTRGATFNASLELENICIKSPCFNDMTKRYTQVFFLLLCLAKIVKIFIFLRSEQHLTVVV